MKNLIYILVLTLVVFNCSKDDEEIKDLSLYTYVPDNNFERLLIDEGYDDKIDNYVLTDNIKNVEILFAFIGEEYNLHPNGYGISDFTGLEDFTNLRVLNCMNNNLTHLDLSKNTALTSLNCRGNQLTNLNLTNNIALSTLECYENNLTTLDLSNNINLQILRIGYQLFGGGNPLTTINLSNNTELSHLDVTNNNLTSLDISNIQNLSHLFSTGNNIDCIQVNENLSINVVPQFWNLDPETILAYDCN